MMKFRSIRKLLKNSLSDDSKDVDLLEITNDKDDDEKLTTDKVIISNDKTQRNQLFNTNNNNREDVDESRSLKDGTEEQDLHEMLEGIEIPDFNMSSSIDSDDIVDTKETSSEERSIDYADRLNREEVFSRRYRPSKPESNELNELAKCLRISTSNICLTSCQSTLQELIFGKHSIILKKGPVSFNDQECDLILLTDGFIAVYQKINAYNPLESRYETCQLWSAVEFVEIANFGILRIQMKSGESFEICTYSNQENGTNWFHAIEYIMVLYVLHSPNASTITEIFGWQYKLIRKPAFTAAVTTDMKLLGNSTDINELDDYNQCSPLHYAIQCEPCSVDIIDALLRVGADPNLPDGEGRSAMYYAQQNNLNEIKEILKSYGGKKSALIEIERKGQLFGSVDEAKRNTMRRREIEQAVKDNKVAEAAAKAKSAQSQMTENMNALLERGEKINALDDKAQQLNDEARAYGQLASQLKHRAKSKKWYQL